MLEVLMDDKRGTIWNISDIVADITWKTSRIGKPGTLDLTLIKNSVWQDSKFAFNNGDIIRFRKDNQNVFYGYIFSINSGRDENVKLLCYDQIRYLTGKAMYSFANKTASEVLRKIAGDYQLTLGDVDDTGYKIPTMLEDNVKLLDIICKALDYTLINGYGNFVLFDDFGSLSLRNVKNLRVPFWIGEESLMYDYSAKRSIDSDTYNKIKLYRDNKETGMRDIFVAQRSDTIAQWGLLLLYQSVDDKMNDAQIMEMQDQLLLLRNRESKTLKVDAIGDLRIRAGSYVSIVIHEMGVNQPYLVDECQHKFDGAQHIMSLDLKVVD
ncbi:XkdQ/YqbQ family protein [Paenibacillus nasutitermitis]|uniref:YqbQ/XkdQ domain-containing protein n=1 Tax=Paenibacillus nasutitermitis TaxID=1652958 RepID=A0A916ZG04_9BACL|nr:hypothetical protein [Paenibacillus nasutitermitis]GGD95169.1 hypothetical protein GCM10010911_62350 [Paenibacillus nasutitermitis]